MSSLVAWVVELYEDWHEVVFERSEARARVRGARKEGLEPHDVKARREPRFDAHAPGPVPAEALLAAGWWLPCEHCNHRVVDDGCPACVEAAEEEAGHEVDWAPSVTCGQEVWCSEACCAAEARERRTRRENAAVAKACAMGVLPEAAVTVDFHPSADAVELWLRVPGCKDTVSFYWPSGKFSVSPRDLVALRSALGRNPLEMWESEGGAVHG